MNQKSGGADAGDGTQRTFHTLRQVGSEIGIKVSEILKNWRHAAITAMQFGIAIATVSTFVLLSLLLYSLVNRAYDADQAVAVKAANDYHAFMMEVAKNPAAWQSVIGGQPAKDVISRKEKAKEEEAAILKDIQKANSLQEVEDAIPPGTSNKYGLEKDQMPDTSTAVGGVPLYFVPERLINSTVILALIAALITQLGSCVYLLVKSVFQQSDG